MLCAYRTGDRKSEYAASAKETEIEIETDTATETETETDSDVIEGARPGVINVYYGVLLTAGKKLHARFSREF